MAGRGRTRVGDGEDGEEGAPLGIYLLRKRGQYIGSVEAPDAEAAIATAIKKFDITDPNRQRRLSAQREG